MSDRINQAWTYLAARPEGTATLTVADAREFIDLTEGFIFACGSLYDIQTTDIGCGIVRVGLKLRNGKKLDR